jgi:thiol-disulfide isomerase/thioredoxin
MREYWLPYQSRLIVIVKKRACIILTHKRNFIPTLFVLLALFLGACRGSQTSSTSESQGLGDDIESGQNEAGSITGQADTAAPAEADPPNDGPKDDSESTSAATPDEPDISFAGTAPAPDFPSGLDWLNTSGPLTLSDLRGKVVLLDFWTYGCINCIHIIPELKELEEKYAEELVVIGVHSAKFENEGDTENIRRIVQRYELEHPVVNDREFQIWTDYGARAWPTLVLIDPEGNVLGYHAGEAIYDRFDFIIGGMISEFDAIGRVDRRPLENILAQDLQVDSPLLSRARCSSISRATACS